MNLRIVFWAYMSEIILTTLIAFGAINYFGLTSVTELIGKSAVDFVAGFAGIMLAGSIAFFWTFYSKSDTPFSQWLYDRGAFNIYLVAYITAIAIYTILSILLILNSKIKNDLLSLVAFWFLILGAINVYSFLRNIIQQLKLNMEFNKKVKGS